MNNHLHIVSFDAPSPPLYGGAIDVYHKIIALANAGVQIKLHYFQYVFNRHHQGLENYCTEIYSYNRKQYWKCLASPLPFIVASRINQELISNLNKDQHPILLEGIHCTGLLPHLAKDRKVMLRLHNNEASYYQRLASFERHPFRNLYFIVEGNRLERYQRRMQKHIPTAAIAQTDAHFFSSNLGWIDMAFIPAFTPWNNVQIHESSGDFYMYHGNLAVSENEAVVMWLLKHVDSKCNYAFVVAGSNASSRLKKAIGQQPNVRLINNPSDEELDLLIRAAQVHLLPSLNQTGVKLKLLHALFCGRHCISNAAGVWGSGLADAVRVVEDADAMLKALDELMQMPFSETQKKQRQALLQLYNNEANAQALIERVW